MEQEIKRCDQQKCENIATHRMFWPGNDPSNICEICKPGAENIAKAMGFHLVIEEMEANDGTESK